MRQTDLTPAQIIESLDSGFKLYGYPRCLLVNELGELAKEGDVKAQKKLGQFLMSENWNDRFIAYGNLMSIQKKSWKLIAGLKKFSTKEWNEGIPKRTQEEYGIAPLKVMSGSKKFVLGVMLMIVLCCVYIAVGAYVSLPTTRSHEEFVFANILMYVFGLSAIGAGLGTAIYYKLPEK